MTVTTVPAIIHDGKVETTTPLELPEGSEVYIVLPPTVTEKIARRTANQWLVSEVGNLLMANEGMLIRLEQDWRWRFNVYVTSIAQEPSGPIGVVDVDAANGMIVAPEETKATLYTRELPSAVPFSP